MFWLAWHHDWRSFWSTELGVTLQQGMGVLYWVLFCATAKPARAEAATKRVE